MSAPDKFVLDLSDFVKKAKVSMDQVTRKIVLDLGTSVVMKSPVGDGSYWQSPPPKGYTGGRFRANWQYGENVKPSGVLDSVDPSGANTLRALAANVRPQAAGKVHFLTNNLPYALRLEQGWSYRQAPAGMVAITVVEYQSIVRNAAAAART